MAAEIARRELANGLASVGVTPGPAASQQATAPAPAQDGTPVPGIVTAATRTFGMPGAGLFEVDALRSTGGELIDADRAVLMRCALASEIALATDHIQRQPDGSWPRIPETSPMNIGSYLWAIVAGQALGFVDVSEAANPARRTVATVAFVAKLGRYQDFHDKTSSARRSAWDGSPRFSAPDRLGPLLVRLGRLGRS